MKWHCLLTPVLAAALLCSCTPQTPPAEDTSPPPAVQVEVDWSKLEGEPALQPDLDAGRWYDTSVDSLIPCEDYGPLCSYVGTTVVRTGSWVDENGVEHTWTDSWGTPVYGLMTRAGKVVTDPVYQSVYRPTYRSGSEVTSLPVLLLGKADESWDPDTNNGLRYAVAALDGSWCTEHEFWTYTIKENVLLLIGPEGVTCMEAANGARRDWTWDSLEITSSDLPELLESVLWLYGFQWTDEGAFLGLTDPDDWENTAVRLFDLDSGHCKFISRQQWDNILDERIRSNWDNQTEWIYTLDETCVILSLGDTSYQLPVPPGINTLHGVEVNGDLAILRDYSGSGDYWLYHIPTGSMLTRQNGYIGFLQDSTIPDSPAYVWVNGGQEGHTIYTPDFTLVASFPEDTGPVSAFFTIQDGLLFARDDCTFFSCYDLATGACIFYRNLDLGD